MTADPKKARDTVNTFVRLYRDLRFMGLEGLIPQGGFLDDHVKGIEKLSEDKPEWYKYATSRAEQAFFHKIANDIAKQTHDKIPYSFIGSIIKSGHMYFFKRICETIAIHSGEPAKEILHTADVMYNTYENGYRFLGKPFKVEAFLEAYQKTVKCG